MLGDLSLAEQPDLLRQCEQQLTIAGLNVERRVHNDDSGNIKFGSCVPPSGFRRFGAFGVSKFGKPRRSAATPV
jgi:hypothetical protein